MELQDKTIGQDAWRLDDFVHRFEASYQVDQPVCFDDYLPPADDDLYLPVLCELIRIDLEFRWEDGQAPDLVDDYLRRFPRLVSDPSMLRAIVNEDDRLRQRRGRRLNPSIYRNRIGVEPEDNGSVSIASSIRQFHQILRFGHEEDPETLPTLRGRPPLAAPTTQRGPLTNWPPLDHDFHGFHLIEELGRGAFSRVYLARQGDLANRLVALKVTTGSPHESQALARLQHTHIVPIYSTQRAEPFQILCMPYFGATTLEDLLKYRRQLPGPIRSASWIANRLEANRPRHLEATDPTNASSLQRLRNRSYEEAVLRIGQALAEGLAHAHANGIVHRDLKPANVLMTDDGQPMLLDFNLSVLITPHSESDATVGGTLPYMAPEHLDALQGRTQLLDARSDLYSLGVLLYELLIGQRPFPTREVHPNALATSLLQDGLGDDELDKRENPKHRNNASSQTRRLKLASDSMAGLEPGRAGSNGRQPLSQLITDRLRGIPRLYSLVEDHELSPALASILIRCLQPEPARRYRSADELVDDIRRHLEDRPLRYAINPSWSERLSKFRRRHRRMILRAAVLFMAALALSSLGAALAYRDHLSRAQIAIQAPEKAQQIRNQVQLTLSCLFSRGDDRRRYGEGWRVAEEVIDQIPAEDPPPWFVFLPAEERRQLLLEIGTLCYLLADRDLLLIKEAERDPLPINEASQSDPTDTRFLAERALEANRRAEVYFETPPRILWHQRAEILSRLDQPEQAHAAILQAQDTAPNIDGQDLIEALDLIHRRQFNDARVLLKNTLFDQPNDVTLQFLLGSCYYQLQMHYDALSRFETCESLDPNQVVFRLNSAWALFRMKEWDRALSGFDWVLEHQPGRPDVLIDRAEVHRYNERYKAALKDLSSALKSPDCPITAHFLLARVYRALGIPEEVDYHLDRGLKKEPVNERDCVSQGSAQLQINQDEQAALNAFREAIDINPSYILALNNIIYVLSELQNNDQEALEYLNQVIATSPDYQVAYSLRGVIRARLGMRSEALADAEQIIRSDLLSNRLMQPSFSNPDGYTGRTMLVRYSPTLLIQLASIYAQTSRLVPEDAEEAIRWLASALRQGYDPEEAETDRDLDPIRKHPDFQRLLQAARVLDSH